MLSTFRHSGDLGDVIYAMPTMRALGGGSLLLYPHRKTRVTRESTKLIQPLLEAQKYIDSVEYSPLAARYDLDEWLGKYDGRLSLAVSCARAFGLPDAIVDEPWIELNEMRAVAPVVMHRSPRYRLKMFPWHLAVNKYRGKCVFVGLKEEHQDFVSCFGYIPYYPTKDFLELAEVIAGSWLYIGNQSSPYAVAEGLKHNSIQEVWLEQPNCLFDRANAGYGINGRVHFPELL